MQQQSLSQSHVRELILYVKYMKESNSISNRFCQCCFLWPSSEVAAIMLFLERTMFILFRNLNLFAQTPWPEHQAAEPMWCVGWLRDNSFSRLSTEIICDMLMTGTLLENAVLLRNFLGSKVLFLLLLFTFFFFSLVKGVCVDIYEMFWSSRFCSRTKSNESLHFSPPQFLFSCLHSFLPQTVFKKKCLPSLC